MLLPLPLAGEGGEGEFKSSFVIPAKAGMTEHEQVLMNFIRAPILS